MSNVVYLITTREHTQSMKGKGTCNATYTTDNQPNYTNQDVETAWMLIDIKNTED